MQFTTVFASVAVIAASIVSAAPFNLDTRATGTSAAPYFSGFDVVYKNAAEAALDFSRHDYLCPYDYSTSVGAYSPCDLNKGFGGQSIYLVPKWTNVVSLTAAGAAKTYIRVNPTNLKFQTPITGKDGDATRMTYESGAIDGQKPLRRVALYRSSKPLTTLPAGYKWSTTDINDGRGGDYLYIIFSN